jgi:hypothetical protein
LIDVLRFHRNLKREFLATCVQNVIFNVVSNRIYDLSVCSSDWLSAVDLYKAVWMQIEPNSFENFVFPSQEGVLPACSNGMLARTVTVCTWLGLLPSDSVTLQLLGRVVWFYSPLT